MNVADLMELAERVEAAAGPNYALEVDITRKLFGKMAAIKPYTASLDAAMMLVPEGWSWTVDAVGRASCFAPNEPKPWPRTGGLATTPALALCAAALRARANSNQMTVERKDG